MLYLYPMDETGCGHYRMLHPYNAMPDEIRAQIKVIPPGGDGGIQASVLPDGSVTDVQIPDDCTALVVQRPTSVVLVNTLRVAQSRGVDIILDVDDDLETVSTDHPSYWALRDMPGHDSVFPRLTAATIATSIVVSTVALYDKFRMIAPPDVPVYLCRNRVPQDSILPPMPRPDADTVGWPGAVATHPGDLDTMGGAIAQLGKGFTIVGDKSEATPRLGIPDEQIRYTGMIDFHDWIPALQTLTVGVVPLRDTPFCRCKSALKALELAAAGVPMVRNTLPEFEELGIGLPARKPRQWRQQIERLLMHDTLWEAEQERNHRIVRANTYEEHIGEWVKAWGLGG